MKNRAERTLEELYKITERITEPEITPVLKGSCRIQGPVDESDHELHRTNSGILMDDKKFMKKGFHMRAESGTCNVCSAPCSSCMHNNRTMLAMESKIEHGSSCSRCVEKEADSCSFICADRTPLYKSRKCDDLQREGSEASNQLSASSSHDSYSENAESKAILRASGTCEAPDDVDMPSFIPLRKETEDQSLQEKRCVMGVSSSSSHNKSDMCHRRSLKQDEEIQRLECLGDNLSYVTGVEDSNSEFGHHSMGLDKKVTTCIPALTDILLSRQVENTVQVKCEDSAITACFDKSDLSEIHLPKPNSSLKVQSLCSPSQNTFVVRGKGDYKDLRGNSSCHLRVDVESSLGTQTAGNTNFDVKKPTCNHENGASYTPDGFSADDVKNDENCLDKGTSCDVIMNSTKVSKEFETSSSLVEASDRHEHQLQSQQVMEGGNTEAEAELSDTRICDICGDAGREDLLAICSRCSDGAEHTYCMRVMLRKPPEGDWLCEDCQLRDEAERQRANRPEKASGTAKECVGDAEGGKVNRSEKASPIAKESKLKEHSEVKEEDRSEVVPRISKECKQQEDIESKKVGRSETVPGSSKLTAPNGTKHKFVSTSNLKVIPKLDMKTIDPDMRKVPKGLQSPTIAKRHAESQEVISPNNKRPPEISGRHFEMGSPRKRLAPLPENSFKKLDTGRERAADTSPSNAGRSANSKEFSRSQSTVGSHLSKTQTQLKAGALSRSNSLSNVNLKAKVIQLAESVPVKSKITRVSSLNNTRKEDQVRPMTKSASFKGISSGRCYTESKTQFIHPSSRSEDPRSPKHVKERNTIEKKNTSMLDRPPTSSSPRAGSGLPLLKIDIKTSPHDIKFTNTLESNTPRVNKRLDDTNDSGRKGVKKQTKHPSKLLENASLNTKGNNKDQRPSQTPKEGACGSYSSTDKIYNNAEIVDHRGVLQTADSSHRDDKTKDPGISKQAVFNGSPISRCQRCNETGHTTQFCSIDKLRSCALMPSSEKNLKDGSKRANKWRDAVEKTMSNSKLQKDCKQSNQSEELPVSWADPSGEVAAKDIFSSSSNHPSNIPLVVEKSDGQEISISSDADHIKSTHIMDVEQLQSVPPVEASCPSSVAQANDASCIVEASESNVTVSISDKLNTNHLLHTLPDQASALADLYRTSAVPDLDFIWQGSLEVLTTGYEPAPFDGIQAHLSTSASPKVLEITTKFPSKVQLEEVPWISSWPFQLQGISPDENNIALFFFAKDVDSYERSYSKLLEKMLKNDLALRGIVDGVELLIFPSTKLPVHSQRWNMLFFLWGIFKGRTTDGFMSKPTSQKKPCGLNLNVNPVIQDLSCALDSVVSDSLKALSFENCEGRLPSCDVSSKANPLKSTACVETWAISSPKVEDRMCSTPAHNSSFQSAAYNRLPWEQSSNSVAVSHTISSSNKLSSLLSADSEPRFQMPNTPPCLEVKSEDSCPKNLGHNFGGRHVTTPYEQSELSRASPSCSASLDRRKGEEISTKSEATFYNYPQWKDKANYLPISFLTGDERERKRTCIREETSSKIHPLLGSFLNDRPRESIYGAGGEAVNLDKSTRLEEKFLFPVEPSPIQNAPSDNLIHILSSDDEDFPESNTPNLELALGGRWKEPIKDDDDVSASLSLSLAIPTPKKEWPAPNLKSEQHLQDRPDVNTALLLFGDFPGT